MEYPIVIENLTKDYGEGQGIFDINLKIKKGEMIGFVGTNGSGKTTTIRSILGYIKPTKGKCIVLGKESWTNSAEIAKSIGYVPGEIGFPDLSTGTVFLKSQAEFFNLKDMSYANELIKKLQLDPNANLKRMSKGMKQKTALVAALMNDAEIIILDEPTTGLDPLMRVAFMQIIMDQHKKGKTIFMSSHMFNEVEESCDRVALIDKGYIIDVVEMNDIKNRPIKEYKIEFTNKLDYQKAKKLGFEIVRDQEQYNQITIRINNSEINELMKRLSTLKVKFISEEKYTLEKHFREVLKEKRRNK